MKKFFGLMCFILLLSSFSWKLHAQRFNNEKLSIIRALLIEESSGELQIFYYTKQDENYYYGNGLEMFTCPQLNDTLWRNLDFVLKIDKKVNRLNKYYRRSNMIELDSIRQISVSSFELVCNFFIQQCDCKFRDPIDTVINNNQCLVITNGVKRSLKEIPVKSEDLMLVLSNFK